MRLEKLTECHLELLMNWLNEPHIKGVYDNGYTNIEDVRKKFLYSKDQRYIAYDNLKPVGYIHSYVFDQSSPFAHKNGKTLGIDLFIGDRDVMRKGCGSRMVFALLDQIQADVERVVVEVDHLNLPSIQFFQKCGFLLLGKEKNLLFFAMNIRRAARALLWNVDKGFLLIEMVSTGHHYKEIDKRRGFTSTQKEGKLPSFWVTPGGKIEVNETLEEALIREIWEEVGIREIQIGDMIAEEHKISVLDHFPTHIINYLFLVHTPDCIINTSFATPYEQKNTLQTKWWSIEEFFLSKVETIPANLAFALEALRVESFP